MSDHIMMYDETEQTTTRYVGFISNNSRFDLMITVTEHFFGKQVVTCLQTGRSAILNNEEAANIDYIAHAFGLSQEDANELMRFLTTNL